MRQAKLDEVLAQGATLLGKGPVALIFAEDAAEIASTVAHHRAIGFRTVLLFLPRGVEPDAETAAATITVNFDTLAEGAVHAAVTAVARAAPEGTWLYYCYNAEYLFFPFCESRTVGEMLAFNAEERRAAMLTYVVDLYADDLARWPDAVSRDRAFLDRSGYYALARPVPPPGSGHLERQFDFFGGLRWRFEEVVPPARRRIDRIALFRARRGLALRPDHTLNDEELNTYASAWHNSLTAAICSFRAAKALRANPASRDGIGSFVWHNSIPFEWHSQQLLDLGLMEPGQWF
jgi:hypothetical protein